MVNKWVPALRKELRSTEAIEKWANRYSVFDLKKDSWIEDVINNARNRGHLTRFDLACLGRWKMGPQNKDKIKNNHRRHVERRSAASLMAKTDEERMGHMRALEGVGLAVTSAFLHFAFPRDNYPIIDFRAVRSLGKTTKEYGDSNWPGFLEECRRLTERYQVDMRTLDRALWQFDLEQDFCKQIAEDVSELSVGEDRIHSLIFPPESIHRN